MRLRLRVIWAAGVQASQSAAVRPMRAEARGLLIDALRDAYCWLDELTTNSSRTIESLAARELVREWNGKLERVSACERRSPIALRRWPAAAGSMVTTRGWMWRRSSSWQQSRLPNALACQATRTLQPQGARSPMTEAVAVTPRWRRREAREYLQSFLRAQFGKGEPAAPASPSRGPGNGILRAETGGRIQAQNAGEQSEFGSQTTLRLTNPPELRGFLSTRKPPRFVGTACPATVCGGRASRALSSAARPP